MAWGGGRKASCTSNCWEVLCRETVTEAKITEDTRSLKAATHAGGNSGHARTRGAPAVASGCPETPSEHERGRGGRWLFPRAPGAGVGASCTRTACTCACTGVCMTPCVSSARVRL